MRLRRARWYRSFFWPTAAEVATLLEQHLATLQQGTNVSRPALETNSWSALFLRQPRIILAFSLLAGVSALVWLASQQAQRNTSLLKNRMSDTPQMAPTEKQPENGEKGLAVSSSGGPAQANESGLGLSKGRENSDAFDGATAGDRREMTELKIAFRWCPPGRFLMGSPKSEVGNSNDENQFEVIFPRGFWMQETEVTQSEWETLMGSLPSHELNKGKGDQYPIYYISFDDATKYCRKLTDLERNAGRLPSGCEFQLPTEAQWEYACRAGTTTASAFGDKLCSSQANFNGDWPHNGAPKGPNYQKAVKVRSYLPNVWGLYDLHGNVKEFTATPWRVRGGSWYDSGRNCCSAIFIPEPPTASESVGFRVVLVSEP